MTIWTRAAKILTAPDRGLDHVQVWLDRLENRRSVSRFRVVRLARTTVGRLDARGWAWGLIGAGTLGLMTRDRPEWLTLPLAVLLAYASLCVGAAWARRNQVGNIHVITECACDPFHEGDEH